MESARTTSASHHYRGQSPHAYTQQQPYRPPPHHPPYASNGHITSASPVNNSPLDTRSHSAYGPPAPGQPPHYPYPPASAPPRSQHRDPQPPPPSSAPQQPHPAYRSQPLAPIHDQPAQLPPYPAQTKAESGNNLPALRPPSGPHSAHEANRPLQQEHPYGQRNGSGHATPASVNQRSYSQELPPPQRTPTSPTHPGPYSAGAVQDGLHASPKQMEHVQHHGYPPQGIPHHLPPPSHAGPQHHAGMPPLQPPQPSHDPHGQYVATPIVEHHAPPYAVQGPPPTPIYQQAYGPTAYNGAAGAKRRAMRAQQACDQCRQRKQKCDEGNPCSFCREQNIACHYRDTPPVKIDKNTEKIMEKLDSIMHNTDSISALRDELRHEMRQMEARLSHRPSERSNATSTPTPPNTATAVEPEGPRDHRTGPHKLIALWPSMRSLFEGIEAPDDNYVMTAEERGILRIYGKGEGVDEHYGVHHAGPASPARSEDSSEGGSTPREGLWGRGFTGSSGSDTAKQTAGWGGMRPDGTLDLDAATVIDLFEQYSKHIHVMHPFLDMNRTKKLLNTFMDNHSPGKQKPNRAGFAAASSDEIGRPKKRTRVDPEHTHGWKGLPSDDGSLAKDNRNPLGTEHSPQNAIIWLILALGKICKHAAPLPSIVRDNRGSINHTSSNSVLSSSLGASPPLPYGTGLKPSPISPKSTPITVPTPPENINGLDSRSRRSSFDSNIPSGRNVEVVPGLAYYAKAAEIMGDQHDGNEIVHAQMFLLAALYKGQLARVKESMSSLVIAGRACQILIEQHKLYRPTGPNSLYVMEEIGKKLKDRRNRLIIMASWSCLQLESDILAEMKFPGSGIQALEGSMCPLHPVDAFSEDEPYMNGDSVHSDKEQYSDDLVSQYYSAQLFLRRRLNNAHRQLYGDQFANLSTLEVQRHIAAYEQEIEYWRQTLPERLRWQDDEPPAKDILNARLRAKYYGAKYVFSRPFLDFAMHILPGIKKGQTVEKAANASNVSRDRTEILLFDALKKFDEQHIWDQSRACIKNALRSTVAFDGISPHRLIVTNIHGTAHAQFGNMLVLAAAYNIEWLRDHLSFPVEEFRQKLDRTIQFLHRLSPISPTCAIDCSILRRIQLKLFSADSKQGARSDTEPLSASNSFSN